HAHPELAREETRTTDLVAGLLADAGVAVLPLPGTGVLAEVGAVDPAYRVALRADMDALPLTERTGLDFASGTPGVCHACGHDVHTAALLGAVLALKEIESGLVERRLGVRAVFQAAEEVMPGGAIDAIAHGALDGVDAIYAVHCDPSLDVGEVGLREGALTAACDQVTVTLHGRGGHTSRPQLTEDLTYALATVVTEVPAVLSRRLDPRSGASLVWGGISAGRAPNVIPATGECRGTLRMLDAEAWLGVGPILEEAVHAVVAPYGVKAQVERVKGVPPVVNAAESIAALRLATLAGGMQPVPTAQSLGGEDFSWYLARVPGAMARVGTRTPGGPTYDLHQGDLVVDEACIAAAARLLASVVVVTAADRLRAGQAETPA
ncbi:MAG: amidohydrolase, partial [Dermatophilaceae bacterium]